jgi:hypothetical protein
MRIQRKWRFRIFLSALTLLPLAHGATAQQLNPALKDQLKAAIAIEQQIPPAQRKVFSGALQNWLAFGHRLFDPSGQGFNDDGPPPLGGHPAATMTVGALPSLGARKRGLGAVAQVSNLNFDLLFSRVGGFTQSTTSTAWCGRNVVVGFNDSTAALDSIVTSEITSSVKVPTSQLGVSFSADDGRTFTDLGFLEPGHWPNTLIGNPSLVCASSERFYYATAPFFTDNPDLSNPRSVVGISISEDGGRKWSVPTFAVNKDLNFHILDKEWLAINRNSPDQIYLTYTDFDAEGLSGVPTARCPNVSRIAIELVKSMDGGHTWSVPSVVREDCIIVDPITHRFTGHVATGSQVAIGHDGSVSTSYLLFAAADGSEQIMFRRSSDHGATLDSEAAVSDVIPSGADGKLQGFFFDQGFHTMAVDNSHRESNGTIYIAWSDGRDNSQIDVISSNGQYAFGDILLSKSTDHGKNWSRPAPVSPTDPNFAGVGRDQFQPGMVVDAEGTLAVCYSDRRNDPQNNLIDHYCSMSRDEGTTFTDIRQTTSSWNPGHGADELADSRYLGDYETVTAESTGRQKGFFSSFQVETDNMSNVQGRSFSREH